jgi:hypothetical protein
MEVDEEIEHMIMKDQARYQAEMNAFDRVKFASIHIGHATVSALPHSDWTALTPLVVPADRHRFVFVRLRCHDQLQHSDSRGGRILLRWKRSGAQGWRGGRLVFRT